MTCWLFPARFGRFELYYSAHVSPHAISLSFPPRNCYNIEQCSLSLVTVSPSCPQAFTLFLAGNLVVIATAGRASLK